MPISLLKKVVGDWQNVRDSLFKDLQKIESYLNAIPASPDSIPPRSDSVFTSPTPAIDTDLTDFFFINRLSEPIQSFTMNLSGDPVEGQRLTIRILDDGTPRVISWGSSFASREATLPTTTSASTYLYIELVYNAITSTWDCLSTGDGVQPLLVPHHTTHETGGSDAITSVAASVITSGQVALARGGTGVDLSASGGTHKILAQDASHVISARDLDAGDTVSGTFATARLGSGATSTNFLRGDSTFADSLPPGIILAYGVASAPSGWALCDGSAISRTTFSALFAIIGTTWGVGNGTTTFNIPDLRGRAPIGQGTGSGLTARTLAATTGEETHLLTTAETPAHSHGVTDPGHTHDFNTDISGLGGGPGWFGIAAPQPQAGVIVSNTTGISIQNAGGGGTHNNMQPSVVVNFIIKT